jgi:hypothetical protein
MNVPGRVAGFGPAALLLALVTWTGSATGAPASSGEQPASERRLVRPLSGPELSLAIGWGDPHGERVAGDDLARVVVGQVPVEASAGFRTAFGLSVLAQGRYGRLIARGCTSSCSGSVVRVGVDVEYHFTPEDRVDHYVAIGAGYEWLALDAGKSRLRYRGPEWLTVAFGEEFPLGPIGIGPVLSLSLGQFTHLESDVPPVPPIAEPIDNRAVHVWLLLGVRVSYGWH